MRLARRCRCGLHQGLQAEQRVSQREGSSASWVMLMGGECVLMPGVGVGV